MLKIKTLHDAYDTLNLLIWHSFSEVGVNAPFCSYFYAEDELYIIKDVMLDNYWFVKAKSPKEAYEYISKRMEEAVEAGAYHEEMD